MAGRWNHLVSETLFANELVVAGIQKLCTVPIRNDNWPVGQAQMYPLHIGLYSYTSGLERLCKLTLACHGYVETGAFAAARKYSHRLSDLMDAVASLDLSVLPALNKRPLARPVSDIDPVLTETIDRFASGAGRYEHLDSLTDEAAEVATLETWKALCAQVKPSERVRELISLRRLIVERLRLLATMGQLEGSAYATLEAADPYLSELSSTVALDLYEKARWVASTLDALTYYTDRELPLLGEAVEDLRSPGERFFQYSVVQIEDEQATHEDLESHFAAFGNLGEDDDEDYAHELDDEQS